MKSISHIKILLLSLLFILTLQSNIKSLNLFLTQDETWLFFPHRYPLKTYSAQCQLINYNQTFQHPQLQTIAYFELNNTCTSIDILSDPTQKQPIFYFAKLLPEECTIYQVREEKISVYYRYTKNHDFKNVLMLNQFNTLLWNDTKMMRIYYSLLRNEVNSYQLPLEGSPIRACSKNNHYSALCWNDKQLIVYNFQKEEIEVNITNFAPQSQYILKTILPLQPDQRIYFVCQSIICNVSRISKDEIITIMTYNFVPRILGGAIYPQTNSIMIVNQQHINIYTYVLFSEIQIKYEQSIQFPQEFECINYDHSVFTKDLIIVECFNFLGQQQKLVLVRDTQTNSYIPYNPFVNRITQDCWLGGNSLHLFTLCTDQITIKNTNFYYLQLNSNFPPTSSKQPSFNLSLQCTNFDGTQQKQQQIFKIEIKKSELGQAYANQLIPAENQMSYSEVKSLKLRNYFKASNIVAYNLESECRFIEKFEYQPIQYLSYFSLYNRQKCVQIISGGGDLFYRLIQINNTVFYLEQCHLNKIGYGCQLSQIYEGSQSVRLGIYDFALIKIFIVEGNLEAKYQNKTKIIFDHKVEQLQIEDNIIRIKTRTSYYTNTVENVINNCGEWISEKRSNRYFYYDSTTLQLNQAGLIKQFQNGVLISQTLFPQLVYNHPEQIQDQQNDTIIKLPYIVKKAYYFFIIGQDYITKFYHREKIIHIYSLPYNPQNYSISDIKLTDVYLTIQYQCGIFQIYDIQEETVSAKLITIAESIMTDVILLAQDVLLIPIQSQTTLIKIQRNPIITIGNFAPSYSRFQETCKFKIKVSVQNGSCPIMHSNSQQESSSVQEQKQQIFQQFKVKIKYNVQQINLGITVETQIQPTQCQNCWIDLNEFQYQGPIFAYQLNDDYFQQFILIPHLEISTCNQKQSILLKNMSEIRFEGDSSSNQVVMSDGRFIYLMDTQLTILNQYKLQDTHYCLSYVKLQQDYLILCNQYLLVLHENQTLVSFHHNLTITSSSRHDLQLQFQKLQNSTFMIYILDSNLKIHIYEYDYNSQTIKHIDNYVFKNAIEDLKVVDNRIIILKINTICLAQRENQTDKHLFVRDVDSATRCCYGLVDIVPKRYTGNQWFEEIIPYYSNESIIKVLLISKNVSNLHIDLTIQIDQYPIAFIITNVYAGYPGFQFYDFIAINLTDDSYSNFIILYQDEVKKNSSFLLAYYPYNYGFEGDRIIGQIKTAHFLQNYFSKPYNFSFLAFEDSMFITHHSGQIKSHPETVNSTQPQQSKQCLSISVHPKLQIKLNYNQTPPIKFLILRANNLISIDSHFIRLHFTEQNQSLEISLIGLTITFALFIILVIATNRCKSSESDIEVHFMREQDEINQPSYEPSLMNQQSSLLHSKTSSQQQQKGQDGQGDYQRREDEIVMIREQ